MKLLITLFGLTLLSTFSIWLLNWEDPVERYEEDDWR